jgi:ribonuclease H / adenosylcobalamin/alpha-ribazole phosphatase
MQPLASRASAAARRLGRVSYEWVPRAQNAHADRLANQAMDEAKNGGGSGEQISEPERSSPERPSPEDQGPRPAPRPG